MKVLREKVGSSKNRFREMRAFDFEETSYNGYTNVIYGEDVVVSFNDDMIILKNSNEFNDENKLALNFISDDYDLGYTVYAKYPNWEVSVGTFSILFRNGMDISRR